MNSNSNDHHSCKSSARASLLVAASFCLAFCCAVLFTTAASAQSWQSISTPFGVSSGTSLLLTDGTVIVQDVGQSDWWKLTPDAFGSYTNGTWRQIASLPTINGIPYSPLYFSSAVLADGRVVVLGGEYNGFGPGETNMAAIYNPVTDTWTPLDGPGWANIGDASTCVLPNGQFLLSDQFGLDVAIMDPLTLSWSTPPPGPFGKYGKSDPNSEEGWTLLPDGTILTVDTENVMNSELFDPVYGDWYSAGSTIKPLPYAPPGFGIVDEMGPQVLRPDGTVVCFGASGNNSIYNWIGSTRQSPVPGTWAAIQSFPMLPGTTPAQLECADAPACLLPNGNVLVCASPDFFNPGLAFFECAGSRLIPEPTTINFAASIPSFETVMLMLPTGQVMLSDFNSEVEFYTPIGSPKAEWAPVITSYPTTIATGQTHTIYGTQFNGLSQCSAYGDDCQNATNYPLVRVTMQATGHVIYYRTHDHSTMGVATGNTLVSTNFDVPATAELGAAQLVVVANGIPSAPVAVTVTQPPLANSQSVATGHNKAASITLTGTDPNNLPLTFAIFTPPSNGALSGLNASTGSVTYTPNSNFQGADSFTFTVNNGTITSLPATVALTVAPGTPTAETQTVRVAHNTSKAITLAGADSDTPPLTMTFAVADAPTHGTLSGLNASTGAVTYTPSNNFQGADSFTFTVSNGTNSSQPGTVNLTIAPGRPTAASQTVAVKHNTAAAITLTGTDPESPPVSLTITIAAQPVNGTLSGLKSSTGAVTYTPKANFQGNDSFTFTVSNATNTSAPATVTLVVAPGTPTANTQALAAAASTATKITLTGTDPDIPVLPLAFAIATQPTNGTLSGLNTSTGAVTYTPKANYKGNDNFTFTVSNGTNTSTPAAVKLDVAPGTPAANAQTLSVAHGATTTITLTGSDPDSPPLSLTFAIASQPANGTLGGLNSAMGSVSYTPHTGFHGTDTFTFTVSNGLSNSAPATVTLNVAAGSPTANGQTVAVVHNTAKSITLTGADGDTPILPLKYTIAASPAHGSVTINAVTGLGSYTPSANYHGADSFTFTVSNGTNSSAPATVTLNVGVGIPIANAQSVTVKRNTAKAITLTGTDSDTPKLQLTYAIAASPAHGAVTINASTGAVIYTPKTNYHGADSFTFTVSNGTNKSAPAKVTINVTS